MTGFDSKRNAAQAKLEPTPWRDMVTVSLVREGINKHKARELADHFAAAQPEQEPVGWEHHEHRPYGGPGEIRIHAVLASQYMMPDGSVAGDFQWLVDKYKKDKNTIKLIPLYATPPAAQRPWVGLTDAEKKTLATAAGCTEDDDGHIVTEIFRLAEAKLKERNT